MNLSCMHKDLQVAFSKTDICRLLASEAAGDILLQASIYIELIYQLWLQILTEQARIQRKLSRYSNTYHSYELEEISERHFSMILWWPKPVQCSTDSTACWKPYCYRFLSSCTHYSNQIYEIGHHYFCWAWKRTTLLSIIIWHRLNWDLLLVTDSIRQEIYSDSLLHNQISHEYIGPLKLDEDVKDHHNILSPLQLRVYTSVLHWLLMPLP